MGVRIRRMEPSALPAVAAIERAITKSRRTSTLQAYVRRQLGAGEGVCLVAAVGETVAGFLVGDVRPWEFGEDREVAWGKVVGGGPRHPGSGLGGLPGGR